MGRWGGWGDAEMRRGEMGKIFMLDFSDQDRSPKSATSVKSAERIRWRTALRAIARDKVTPLG